MRGAFAVPAAPLRRWLVALDAKALAALAMLLATVGWPRLRGFARAGRGRGAQAGRRRSGPARARTILR